MRLDGFPRSPLLEAAVAGRGMRIAVEIGSGTTCRADYNATVSDMTAPTDEIGCPTAMVNWTT